MKHLLLVDAALIILIFISQTGCTSYGQPDRTKPDTLQLPVLTLRSKDTVVSTAYVADIQAIKNIEIRTRVKGFVETIYVDEGRLVKKGQPLFKINDEEYKVALSKTMATLANAVAAARASEVEVQRVQILVSKQVVAASELELAQARLAADNASIQEAKSSVASAQNHLSYTLIRAPFDGLIDRIPLKAGSLTDEGALLTTLSDISSMFAYFSMPENEYLQYERSRQSSPGQRSSEVRLSLSDGSSYAYSGTIETVEGEIEQNTGSIDFRALFPNPQRLLRHGATGKIYLSNKIDNVVLIPQRSAFDIQDRTYVYLVEKDNTLRMQSFVPLGRLSGTYLVREGLHEDDRILYEGAQNVREGMSIRPQPVGSDVLQIPKK